MKISIATDFSRTPGARHASEGKYSGDEFRDNILYPKYSEAIEKNEKLVVNLDGCYGYATSFLEESFGGLVRKIKKKGILNNIIIESEEDESLIELIQQYVRDAEKKL
ncbi:DUF4325 domain-containing protein [Ruminococcus sp. OM08-7]|nr:DUF4325 domain-containing protein [Ruminococcus sp. OM08-7]